MAKPYFTYGVQASDRDLITSTTKYAGAHKRYFSSIDAEMFIGGERIIDIARIDFTYTEQKKPIYGFNSFLPSRIIVGQKLVEGTFIINFTEVGYIANLLERIPESSIANPYDKVGVSCDPLNAALFRKCFDIVIGYGGYNVSNETSYNATFQVIEGVYITGYQQVLDTSGEPIAEVYSFIARNLSYKKTEEDGNIKDNTPTPNPNLKSANNQYDYVVVEEKNKSDVDTAKSKALGNQNYLAIITNITLRKLDKDNCLISVAFPEIINKKSGDKINNIKLTISDSKINLSKTYTLTYCDQGWVCRITDKSDIEKLNSKINSGKGINCSLEFSLYRTEIDTVFKVNKSCTMYISKS